MPYYTPASAIERPDPVADSARTLVGLSCGDTMKHLRTIPKLGVRPQKLTFVCPSCQEVQTKELMSTRRDTAQSCKSPDLM